MSHLAVLILSPSPDNLHKMLSMLAFQRGHDFQAYILDDGKKGALKAVSDRFEGVIPLRYLTVSEGEAVPGVALQFIHQEPLILFMDPALSYGKKAFRRMLRCTRSHPEHDLYHWNLDESKRFPRRPSDRDMFKGVFYLGWDAPLGSFVFRTAGLKDFLARDPQAGTLPLAMVLALAHSRRGRCVRWERLPYSAPPVSSSEVDIMRELAFFSWSERFYGDAYPIGVSARIALFAKTLAKRSPGSSYEQLKEDLYGFQVVSGPIRKLKATAALKAALKEHDAAAQV